MQHVPACFPEALFITGGSGPRVPCCRFHVTGINLLICSQEIYKQFYLFIFFLSFPAVCSNLNFSGLLLKCQHFWSTAQYQERPGTSPSTGAHISPPAGPWDRQDFFSPRSSSNVLTHTVVHVVFLRILFYFPLILMNPNYESKVIISDVNYTAAEQLLPLLLA